MVAVVGYYGFRIPPAARVMLPACAAALVMAALLSPVTTRRLELFGVGLVALASLAALAVVPNPIALAVLLLLVAAGHAARPGIRPLAARLRGPALAAILLGLGGWLLRAQAPETMGRVGAAALVLGLAAAAGLIPYLQELEAREPAGASPLAWTAFFGPAIGLVLPIHVLPALTASEAQVYGAVTIALGLINLVWGTLGAWRAGDEMAAWRYSFLADWGLAFVGLGILLPAGQAAALLILLSVVLVRLPLYLWARPVLLGRASAGLGPVNLVVAVALAGAAPFAGFAARVLLLRGATQIYWPLAVLLVPCLLLWVAHSLRLARGLGRPAGRTAVGVGLALGFSLALGVAPGVFLAAAGL